MGCRMSTHVWQVAGWNVLKERNKNERTECRTQDGYWQVRANKEEKYRSESDGEMEKQFFWMNAHKTTKAERT